MSTEPIVVNGPRSEPTTELAAKLWSFAQIQDRPGMTSEMERLAWAVHAQAIAVQYAEKTLGKLDASLRPLCPCVDYPEQECPLHGDGVTFVAAALKLRAEHFGGAS